MGMAYRLAQYKAMEECGKYGQFTTLPGDASNPWMNVPQPVDSRRNPLSKLFNGNSNSDKWTNLWSDFLNGRSKRQAEEGLLEIDEAAELEQFLEDYDEFKTDIGSMIGNLTCILTKLDMLDSSLQVDLKLWTTDIWQQMNLRKTLAGEDPHHQGLWSPHDLLQVRHETREEDVRNGSDVLLADHPLRQQRRLQLEPVRSSN